MHNIDPVLLNIGPLQIRYYGLVYAAGFFLALLVLLHSAKKKEIKNFDKDAAYDFMLYLILGTIICARLFYELVYNFSSFISNPLQFFYFWQGGMAFHGGVIGASASGLYFCRKKKIDFYSIADIIVLPLALMLGFGRIANFLNGELWGKLTDRKSVV